MRPFPELVTKRLLLRGPLEKDVKRVYDVHGDPNVMRYYGFKPYTSLDKAWEHIKWLKKLHEEEIGLRWVITFKEEDDYVGDVGFYDYEKKHNRAEIGYILEKKHWGKGVMSEALKAALGYGFDVMKLNRIQALIDPRNAASLSVAEKHGFQYEGTFRDYEYEYGGYIDLGMYSVLRCEYVA